MRGWQVAHVITHLELGGAQLATLSAAQHSRFFTGRRTLIAGPHGRLCERAARIDGVELRTVPELVRELAPARDSLALARLVRVLRRLRRSGERLLVHTHSPKAGVIGRVAARLAAADLVVHSVHGFGHGHGQTIDVFRGIERSVSRFADGYTTDSESNRRQGIEEGLFSDRPARVVHCGIELELFQRDLVARSSVRRELRLDSDAPLIVCIGNLKAQKDPITFVRTAARVSERVPSARFIYAGDGPLRREVERTIERLGVGSTVTLLGWRDDPARLLSASDIFLLTSLWEGLPQSFAQAMAAGVPIVATRVDGAPEAVEHGESGFLADAGDVESLSEFVVALAENAQLRSRFAARGSALAPRFSRDVMIDQLDRFYRELSGVR